MYVVKNVMPFFEVNMSSTVQGERWQSPPTRQQQHQDDDGLQSLKNKYYTVFKETNE